MKRLFLNVCALCVLLGAAAHADKTPEADENSDSSGQEVVTVRPSDEVASRQGLPYFVGISEDTAGAQGISMNLVIIPPGGAAEPHLHKGYESAVYLLEGRVKTCYGEGLKQSVVNKQGDFLFIPADVPHQPRNLSSTERAVAVVSRNDPDEQESVVPYEEAENDCAATQ